MRRPRVPDRAAACRGRCFRKKWDALGGRGAARARSARPPAAEADLVQGDRGYDSQPHRDALHRRGVKRNWRDAGQNMAVASAGRVGRRAHVGLAPSIPSPQHAVSVSRLRPRGISDARMLTHLWNFLNPDSRLRASCTARDELVRSRDRERGGSSGCYPNHPVAGSRTWAATRVRSRGVDGDLVRAADRDPLANAAEGDGLRVGQHVLATSR
jgi:hypothetical protein